ncbi:MAG TPA: tetratricopeptide repeat protein, partial [Terriglobales bacterium]
MYRSFLAALAVVFLVGVVVAQVQQLPSDGKAPAKNQAPPRSQEDQPPNQESSKEASREGGFSSSKNTQIDISPPADDIKNHPDSGAAMMDANSNENADVQEMRPWDPHRAAKDIEVGDYYFKRKNYRAALGRYQEALEYKPNDAQANFQLAQCYEKLNDPDQAAKHFQEYLKILPQGVLAPEARK